MVPGPWDRYSDTARPVECGNYTRIPSPVGYKAEKVGRIGNTGSESNPDRDVAS